MFSKSSFYSDRPQQRKVCRLQAFFRKVLKQKDAYHQEISILLSEFKFLSKLVFDKAKPNSIYFFILLKMHKCDMVLIRERVMLWIKGFGIN